MPPLCCLAQAPPSWPRRWASSCPSACLAATEATGVQKLRAAWRPGSCLVRVTVECVQSVSYPRVFLSDFQISAGRGLVGCLGGSRHLAGVPAYCKQRRRQPAWRHRAAARGQQERPPYRSSCTRYFFFSHVFRSPHIAAPSGALPQLRLLQPSSLLGTFLAGALFQVVQAQLCCPKRPVVWSMAAGPGAPALEIPSPQRTATCARPTRSRLLSFLIPLPCSSGRYTCPPP